MADFRNWFYARSAIGTRVTTLGHGFRGAADHIAVSLWFPSHMIDTLVLGDRQVRRSADLRHGEGPRERAHPR